MSDLHELTTDQLVNLLFRARTPEGLSAVRAALWMHANADPEVTREYIDAAQPRLDALIDTLAEFQSHFKRTIGG